jgi:hypothetical protein
LENPDCEAKVGQIMLSVLYVTKTEPPVTGAPEMGLTVECILRRGILEMFNVFVKPKITKNQNIS